MTIRCERETTRLNDVHARLNATTASVHAPADRAEAQRFVDDCVRRRVPFATVELGTGWTDAPTALTREGAALLNDVYRPGAQLDPLSVWIDLGRR